MKKLKQTTLIMNGTKKRVGDIKAIFQNIEYSFKLMHTSLISTSNCITFLYSWGHIIIYTFPQDRIITIDFLYPLWDKKVMDIIPTAIAIFAPDHHEIKENDRC